MAEEAAAKLRLKPRKAPPAWSREPSPGPEPPRRTVAGRCSWLEKDDLNECEKPWMLLLKDISQDLQCTNWQTVPSFPEFLGKSSEEESLRQQEVFTVGMKDFQWVSFPSYCEEKHLNPKDLGSSELTQSQNNLLPEGWGQADRLNSLPSTAEETGCATTAGTVKNMVEEDTQGIAKLAASPKPCKVPQGISSARPSALLQSRAEATCFQQQCREAVQHSRDNRKEDDGKELHLPTRRGNASLSGAREVSAEGTPPPVPGTKSCKETENQSEGASTLDSCPMCLLRFSGTLSQLDIDGHLARCLSESADDVMW
ncbi:Fanconi anemia core complex-associated protein 20 [Cuculus canorus]|uniref:Fanconi anemia core complex-associated protein 20 n=1 Tax=Cuculus canorus TaxID=55661 RepID=UPI0023AADEB6|nr:Fanconi anemia core complex-associated protein 20 [Cuculus canorus]